MANSNGILAIQKSNFTALFDFLKKKTNLKASEVVKIFDTYPKFALQYRRELIIKKIKFIEECSPEKIDTVYLRQLIKRHPDLFLKSLSSM